MNSISSDIKKKFKWRFIIKFFVLINLLDLTCGVLTNKSENFQEFQYCLRQSKQPNLRECVGRSALNFLQRFDESENVTLAEDIVVTKDESLAARSLVNFLDADPSDMRGILENAGAVISQRSFEWHMDRLYPGLMLKIGPSADTSSVAEFILDPTIDERNYNGEEIPTARILTKQYLLPILLGLKFNLVSLVPLLFAVICLLLKKSLFIAKLVIYVSSVLGVGGGVASTLGSLAGGLFSSPLGGHHYGHYGHHGHHHHLHGGAFPGFLGVYPGKNQLYSQYNDDDELQQTFSPYKKREDRKVVFDKPRENASQDNERIKNIHVIQHSTEATIVNPPAIDHFYDFEKQSLLQDRSGKLRQGHDKLGSSSTYGADLDAEVGVINTSSKHRFMTAGGNSGWNLVRV